MIDKERRAALNNNRPTLSACMIVKTKKNFITMPYQHERRRG